MVVEEKYGNVSKTSANETDTETSDWESEDDDGVLITKDLDAEILAAVDAIRSKDPRVYDKNAKFYSDIKPEESSADEAMKQKPMYLRDYHRRNLMNGHIQGEEEETDTAPTYVQDQADLKDTVLQGIRKAGSHSGASTRNSDEDVDDDFLIQKPIPMVGESQKRQDYITPNLDVEHADQNPETYLKNFMVSRAWASGSRDLQPFESDEEEEDRADAFEEAYNMRFEDPKRANEKLVSHARDAAAKHSLRRNEPSSRQKTRSLQRQKREAERKEREKERHRLRNFKVEEMEEKVKKIKESAGMHGKDISIDDWKDVLEADWDDERWDAEMHKRFDESYYAEDDYGRDIESGDEQRKERRQKMRKPRWDGDISIEDIAPEVTNKEYSPLPEIKTSEVQNEEQYAMNNSSKKELAAARSAAKRAARLQRRFLEDIVDESLENDMLLSSKFDTVKVRRPGRFRYRDTSPTSFGLSAHEILMAEDSQLNEHVGLKKLNAFRDPEKKKKDKERLNKKSRLRRWRMETFGNREGLKPELIISGKTTKDRMSSKSKVEATDHQDASDNKNSTRRKKKRKRQHQGII